MRTRELIALGVALALVGCVDNVDPRHPTIAQRERYGFGAWIVATTKQGWSVQGELISATPRYVHLLRVGQPRPALVYLDTPAIATIQLYTYEAEGGIGAIGLFGTLSTVSHGAFLLLTAPVWLISTAVAVRIESGHVLLSYPRDASLTEVAKWARFPQGIPPAVDEEALVVPRRRRTPPPARPAQPPPLAAPGTLPAQPPPTNPSALFQEARTAAAANNCPRVGELSAQVEVADRAFWEAVFVKDAAIRACLPR